MGTEKIKEIIDAKDISVVVQGPIFHQLDEETGMEWTERCTKSIRSVLPEAEIILSTWENEDVSKLEYDRVLYNVDPGVLHCTGTNLPNINRQLVSTLNGVKAASRKYVLKLRSESYIENEDFWKYFGLYTNRNKKFRITKNRLIIDQYVDPLPALRPFYASEAYVFGLKEDILLYFDVPLASDQACTGAMKGHSFRINRNRRLKNNYIDNVPRGYEQYYMCEFINKYLREGKEDVDIKLIELSDLVIANNFIVLDGWNSYGIKSLKYSQIGAESDSINFEGWTYLYRKYCDQNYPIDWRKKCKKDIKRYFRYFKFVPIDFVRLRFPKLFEAIKSVFLKYDIELNRH